MVAAAFLELNIEEPSHADSRGMKHKNPRPAKRIVVNCIQCDAKHHVRDDSHLDRCSSPPAMRSIQKMHPIVRQAQPRVRPQYSQKPARNRASFKAMICQMPGRPE